VFTEVATYRVDPGQQEPLKTDAREYHRAVAIQPGFLGHAMGPSFHDQAEYVEAIQWASADDARCALEELSRQERSQAWLQRVDRSTFRKHGMRMNGAISRTASLAEPSVGVWLLVRWRTHHGVDAVTHARNELLMHHEAFAPVPGYLGALIMREVDGPEWMELIGWPSLKVAEERVREILQGGHELVKKHMEECAPGASLHYFATVLRD
jgi:hypothetical protein